MTQRVVLVVAVVLALLAGFWFGRGSAPEPAVQAVAKETKAPQADSDVLVGLPDEVLAALEATAAEKMALSAGFQDDGSSVDGDADDLADDAEVEEYGTDPGNPDTDGDRIPDGREVTLGSDPLFADPGAPLPPEVEACVGGVIAIEGVRQVLSRACTIVTLTAATCTGTCAGTCLGGLGTCGWSWDALQWAYDKANGVVCPGWDCFCP